MEWQIGEGQQIRGKNDFEELKGDRFGRYFDLRLWILRRTAPGLDFQEFLQNSVKFQDFCQFCHPIYCRVFN